MVLPPLPPSMADYKKPFNFKCWLFGCKCESKPMIHHFWGRGILTICKRCGDSCFTQMLCDIFR
jgi:hypothetical protein